MTAIDKLLAATLEITGTKLSDQAVNLMLNRLSRESPDAVKHALSRCAEECRFKVTLADILGRLPAKPDEVPKDPEAAWDMAKQLIGHASEAQTIVAPEAMLRSFPIAAWNEDDQIGARMAFKAVYPGNYARFGNQWTLSDGWDKTSREAAVLEAARLGRISVIQARAILPGVAAEQWTQIEEARKALVAA